MAENIGGSRRRLGIDQHIVNLFRGRNLVRRDIDNRRHRVRVCQLHADIALNAHAVAQKAVGVFIKLRAVNRG